MASLKFALTCFIIIFIVNCDKVNESLSQETIKGQLPQRIESFHKKQINLNEQYKVKLPEKTSIVMYLNNTHNITHFSVHYTSLDTFQTCILNQQQKCPTKTPQQHNKQQGYIQLTNNNISNGILIINPSSQTLIHLTLKFHPIINNCHLLLSKNIYSLPYSLLSSTLCLIFNITQHKDHQLLLQPQSYVNSSNYKFQLCGKSFKPQQKQLHQNRYGITAQMLVVHCSKVQSKELKVQMVLNNSDKHDAGDNTSQQQYMKVVLERSDQPVLLLDGVGYSTTISDPLSPKLFIYDLQNLGNTSINVYSNFKIDLFIQIVNRDLIATTIPSKTNQDFSSKKGKFFTYYHPYIFISSKELQRFDCQNCYLVLSIYPQKSIPDNIIVQITQHQTQLTNSKPNHKYLPKKSIAYYKYHSSTSKDLSIEIADNNQYCTIGYLSKHKNPGPTNNLAKIQQNKLVYRIQENQKYYLGIQAVQSCVFTITVYDGSGGVMLLERGKFGFLDLKEGESKLFWIRSDNDQYLKLMSTQTYGQVQIYLNRTTQSQIHSIISASTLNPSQFQKKGQYPNRLILPKQDPLYHNNEYYLIYIHAQKNTKATLFYGNQNTPIPIDNKTINDIILLKGDKIIGQYLGESKANFKVKVNSGKLRLTFSKDKKNYSKQFESSLIQHKDSFDLQNSDQTTSVLQQLLQIFLQINIKVQFQALQNNTVYSLTIYNFEQNNHTPSPQPQPSKQSLQYINLQSSKSHYTIFTSDTTYIIHGYLRDNKEQIIISCDFKDKDKLNKLNLTMKIDNQTVIISISIVMNILVISLPEISNFQINHHGVKFQLVLKYKDQQNLWLNIMQAEDFALLPPEINAIVNKTYTFIAHANNYLIVDIFSCRGDYSLAYAPSRQQLTKNQTSNLDIIAIANQPHALRINKYATTFFKIDIPLGIVRWFPFDIQSGIGTGYLDYKVDPLQYQNNLSNIKVKGRSLSKVNNQSRSIIKEVNYTLFVAARREDLQFASQCQEIRSEKIIKVEKIVGGQDQRKKLNLEFSYLLQKTVLSSLITGEHALFITIVCDVVLQPSKDSPLDKLQRYRFIYPSLQIPQEIVTSKSQLLNSLSTQHSIIIIIILITISFIILSVICIKRVVPLLARLKNRILLQQDNNVIQNSKPNEKPPSPRQLQGDLEVPMSSDRNNIQSDTAVETDDYLQAK